MYAGAVSRVITYPYIYLEWVPLVMPLSYNFKVKNEQSRLPDESRGEASLYLD